MDVHCSTCLEPWDVYHLRHEAIHDTDLPFEEAAAWPDLSGPERLSDRYREKSSQRSGSSPERSSTFCAVFAGGMPNDDYEII